jgi:GT2 family glycosyltransferase
MNSTLAREIIGFDEKLAVTTEDLDFTWRIWLSGYKIKSCPNSLVFHYTKNIDMRKDMNVSHYSQYFHLNKNSIRTLIKNYQLSSLIWYFPQLILILIIRSLILLFKRKDASSLKALYMAIIWNVINFKNTLNQRYLVQGNRVFLDKYIYENVMVKSSLYEIYSKHFKNKNS